MPIVLDGDVRVAPPVLPAVRVAPPSPSSVVVLPVAGPTGPPGATGGDPFVHTQDVPQSVWTVEHGFGRYPVAWSLHDTSGLLCSEYQVQHLDLNTSRVSMDVPTAGIFRVI